jgi:type II secretory ATPase GspE/PulE/Tfp pilus assembly ATPase PilB-like protein
MDRSADDGSGSSRIDVRSLPDSVARLWETMLRLDPSWDLSEWLDECATDELELVEGHLGRERLRLEQRLHRIETLVKRLRRQREVVERATWTDPHQRNLFDVYEKNVSEEVSDNEVEEGVAAVDYGSLDAGDDPLLAIVAEHVLSIIEEALERGVDQVHFDRFVDKLDVVGIRTDEVDEAVAWLLQKRVITELEQDCFGLGL